MMSLIEGGQNLHYYGIVWSRDTLRSSLKSSNAKKDNTPTIVAINYGQNEEFSQNIAFVGRTET